MTTVPAPRVAPAVEQDTTEALRARLADAEQRIDELTRDLANALTQRAADAALAARQGHTIHAQRRDIRALEDEVGSHRRRRAFENASKEQQ